MLNKFKLKSVRVMFDRCTVRDTIKNKDYKCGSVTIKPQPLELQLVSQPFPPPLDILPDFIVRMIEVREHQVVIIFVFLVYEF